MNNTKKAAVFLATGFEECEALIVVDLLRRAETEVDMVSMQEDCYAISSHNVTIKADKIFSDITISDYDLLVLPGGIPGSTNLRENQKLCKAIKEHYNSRKLIAAICAAPFIFAELGLLNEKTATAHPYFKEKLTENSAKYLDTESVISDNIITGQGLGAAIPFAADIISKLYSADKAKLILEEICYRH